MQIGDGFNVENKRYAVSQFLIKSLISRIFLGPIICYFAQLIRQN